MFEETKISVRSPECDTNIFNIVAGYLQSCVDNVLRTSVDLIKENSLKLKIDKKQTISGRNNNKRRLRR